jgi:hypothetical protein
MPTWTRTVSRKERVVGVQTQPRKEGGKQSSRTNERAAGLAREKGQTRGRGRDGTERGRRDIYRTCPGSRTYSQEGFGEAEQRGRPPAMQCKEPLGGATLAYGTLVIDRVIFSSGLHKGHLVKRSWRRTGPMSCSCSAGSIWKGAANRGHGRGRMGARRAGGDFARNRGRRIKRQRCNVLPLTRPRESARMDTPRGRGERRRWVGRSRGRAAPTSRD